MKAILPSRFFLWRYSPTGHKVHVHDNDHPTTALCGADVTGSPQPPPGDRDACVKCFRRAYLITAVMPTGAAVQGRIL